MENFNISAYTHSKFGDSLSRIRERIGQRCFDAKGRVSRTPSKRALKPLTPAVVSSDDSEDEGPAVNAKGYPTTAGKCPRKEFRN